MKKHNIVKVFSLMTVAALSFATNIVGVKAVNPDEVNSNVPSGTYDTIKTVTLTCTTGKPIHYTNNGSTPYETSPLYTGPLTIAFSQTIKAGCAFGLGSSMSEFKYVITAVPGEVKSNVPSGTYTTAKSVTLSCTSGDPIYYTTNGSNPSTSSTKYTGPITVSKSQKIMAGCSFGLGSSVTELNYVINIAATATPKPTATKAPIATVAATTIPTPTPTVVAEPTYVATFIPKTYTSTTSQTTDLSKVTSVEQLKSVEDFTLDIPQYNMIEFIEPVDLSNTSTMQNLETAVSIDQKAKVSIDDTKLANLNKPAKVTMRNLDFTAPKILRNGVDAKDYISDINYDKAAGTLTFKVRGFSTYEAVEGKLDEVVVSKKEKNNLPIILSITALVVLATGGAGYYFWNQKKINTPKI
jgi:hypothetical protein